MTLKVPRLGLIKFLQQIHVEHFMRNGSSKLLVYNMLFPLEVGLAKISTTTDPQTDRCGYPESTQPLGRLEGSDFSDISSVEKSSNKKVSYIVLFHF